MSKRAIAGRRLFEIHDLLPGWSVSEERYLAPSEDALEDGPNEQLDCSIELSIAPRRSTVGSRFTLAVATPEALVLRPPADSGVLADRAMMVVSQADWGSVRAYLESLVAECPATTMEEAIDYFNQYFTHEYDDFHW